jgi:signal transduction histidine kinase
MSRALDVQAGYARRALYEAARLRLARMRVGGGYSLRVVAQEATQLSARTLLVDRVSIWLGLEEGGPLRCYDLYERATDTHSEGALLFRHDYPEYFRALDGHRVIKADDARTHADTRCLLENYLKPLDIYSMLDVPIYRGGHVVGVVCHEVTGARRTWTQEDADFGTSVADSIALQLEGAARHEAEAQLASNEACLAEVQTMEALGRMTAGVAHDFRNLLTVVLGYANRIERAEGLPPSLREDAARLVAAAEHGVSLTHELAALGRDSDPVPTEPVSARDVIAGFLGVLRSAVGGPHEIAFDGGDSPANVVVPEQRLERVVLNLVLNARDAMPQGGTIEIAVREVTLTRDDRRAGDYVVLEVRDEGEGMSEETARRAFEPFFTGKPGNKGTGLGLAVVHRLVENAGGFVRLESAPGRGTTMRVCVPKCPGRE